MAGVVRAVAVLLVGGLLGQLLGLVRDSLLAAHFGASIYVDALVVAQTIPSVVVTMVSAFALGAVPIRANVSRQAGEQEARSYTLAIVRLIFALSLALSFLIYIGADVLVAWAAPGFSSEERVLTASLVRIIALSLCPAATAAMMVPLLQLEGLFWVTALSGILQNLSAVVSFLYSPTVGIRAVAAGLTVGAFLQLIVLSVAFYARGYRFSFVPNHFDRMRDTIVVGGPLVIVALSGYVVAVVERNLASGLPTGSIAALNYAQKLPNLVSTLLGTSLAAAVFPHLADQASRLDRRKLAHTLNRALLMVSLTVIPITATLVAWRVPVVKVLFERGEFTPVATEQTAFLLVVYALAVPTTSLAHLLRRTLTAWRLHTSIMWCTLLGLVAQIVTYVTFIHSLGAVSLALGSTIGSFVILGTLVWSMAKYLGYSPSSEVWRSLLLICTTSVLVGLLLTASQTFLGMPEGHVLGILLHMLIAGLAGLTIYLAVLCRLNVLRVEDLLSIVTRSHHGHGRGGGKDARSDGDGF